MSPATLTARRKEADQMTAREAIEGVANAPHPDGMVAADMLRELEALAPVLEVFERAVDDMRARRLDLWCAARLLAKPPEGDRPIFVALAEASSRSEALVIKATQKEFDRRGIVPPR
jgi:hypothetical protein